MPITWLCAFVLSLPPAPAASDNVPSVLVSGKKTTLEDLAKGFEKKHALEDADRNEEGARRMLERDYLHFTFGAFDLHYPITFLADAKRGRELNDIATVIVKMQHRWTEWVGTETALKTETRTAAEALTKWLKSWKPADLAKALDQNPTVRDPLVLLKADPSVAQATTALAEVVSGGKYLAAPRASPLRIPVVLAPTRAEFVTLASYLGTLSDSNRSVFWVNSMPSWSDLRWGDLTVLALEFALPSREGVDIAKAYDMNEREATGMQQNVTFKLFAPLLAHDLGKHLDPNLQQGLITNLVIDLLGENNVTLGTGAATSAYQRFVPGGRSSGGKLKKKSAEGRFRDDKGKDHFIAVLKDFFSDSASQRLKAKKEGPPDDRILFAIYAHDDRDPVMLEAPFLQPATQPAVSAPFEDDYKEFMRSYQSAFVFWLQTKAVMQASTPEALLQSLLKAASATPEGETFPFAAKVQEIYGIPWTAADPKADSLEARFLRWLLKP
jgi:hypothetical protein